jgi:hypothetical protein
MTAGHRHILVVEDHQETAGQLVDSLTVIFRLSLATGFPSRSVPRRLPRNTSSSASRRQPILQRLGD